MPTFTRWHTELAEKLASGIPLEQRIPFTADCIESAKPIYADSFGYSLAMRVMQSDLYQRLDGQERAECDELIRRGQCIEPAQVRDLWEV